MAVTSHRLELAGPAGTLEAMLESPERIRAGDDVPAVAVICHPHPQFQGTMLNKVVHTLARSATDCGMPALRFNYRGVGSSAGEYDDGNGETDDADFACRKITSMFSTQRLVLMGFSFGAGVALRLAQRIPLTALVAAAPPVGRLGVPERIEFSTPWQVIQGTADELVDASAVEAWTREQMPTPDLVMMEGVSHFFHGNLTALRQEVRRFLVPSLELSDTSRGSDT